MSRIPPLEPNQGNLFARITLRQTTRRFGRSLEPIAVTARHNALLAGNVAFELALDRASAVSPALRELVQVKAASVAGCAFCLDISSWLATSKGATEEQLHDLHRHAESPHFDAAEKAALDYADALSRTPVSVPDEMFAALRKHFDDRQIVELTGVIAWENYRARFNEALEIASHGFTQGGACALPAAA